MLEYPMDLDNQDGESKEEEQRRYYTCLRCNKPFKTPIGKPNRLKHSPESQQVPRQETFEKNAKNSKELPDGQPGY